MDMDIFHNIKCNFFFLGMHLFLFPYVINVLLKFIHLSISLRHMLALQVNTTPAQHLDSKWFSLMSASTTTSATTSGRTSYIYTPKLHWRRTLTKDNPSYRSIWRKCWPVSTPLKVKGQVTVKRRRSIQLPIWLRDTLNAEVQQGYIKVSAGALEEGN